MIPAEPSLWLELTPHCNLDCKFCYNPWRPLSASDYPKSVSSEDYLQNIVRLTNRIRFAYVALSGGEPLLYRGLDDLVHALHKQDQYTILTTNGRLATRDRLTTLRAAGLSAVQVPILAASPEVHDDLVQRLISSFLVCW